MFDYFWSARKSKVGREPTTAFLEVSPRNASCRSHRLCAWRWEWQEFFDSAAVPELIFWRWPNHLHLGSVGANRAHSRKGHCVWSRVVPSWRDGHVWSEVRTSNGRVLQGEAGWRGGTEKQMGAQVRQRMLGTPTFMCSVMSCRKFMDSSFLEPWNGEVRCVQVLTWPSGFSGLFRSHQFSLYSWEFLLAHGVCIILYTLLGFGPAQM